MKKKIIIILVLYFICFGVIKLLGALNNRYNPVQNIQTEETESGFEIPPVLSAKDVVPESLLSSKNYTILDEVHNDGFFNHYTLKTNWGYFYAIGDDKLKIRVNEMYTIDALKQIKTDEVLIDSAKEGGKKIIMAPVKAVESVGNAILNPTETFEKIQSIPTGVADFFSGITHKIKGEVHHVSNEIDETQRKDREQGKDETSTTQLVAEKGSKRIYKEGLSYAKRWIGYNENVRKLEKQFGILPDTDNELLKEEIARIAKLKTGVLFTTNFIPGIPMFEVISDANSALGMINKISVYEDKVVQKEMVFKELLNIGLPEETIYKFQKLHYLSTTSRTMITNAIINLEGVQGRESLIYLALNLENEEDGRIYTSIVTTLPYLNKKYHFKNFLTTTFLPVAITQDGKAITALTTDYIFWTENLYTIINSALKKTSAEAKELELVISGFISNKALDELTKRNVKVTYLENMLKK